MKFCGFARLVFRLIFEIIDKKKKKQVKLLCLWLCQKLLLSQPNQFIDKKGLALEQDSNMSELQELNLKSAMELQLEIRRQREIYMQM